MPEEFPADQFRGAFDGGKLVIAHAPVPVGEPLVASSQIADVFRKTGRSGAMTFIVHRMEFRTKAGELVSTVDWKLIQKDGTEGA
jgi:hydroxyacyl-ACP dehydratase HTD2-like protein with hotdog domain